MAVLVGWAEVLASTGWRWGGVQVLKKASLGDYSESTFTSVEVRNQTILSWPPDRQLARPYCMPAVATAPAARTARAALLCCTLLPHLPRTPAVWCGRSVAMCGGNM